MVEKRFQVTATVKHVKNDHVALLNAVNDDITCDRQTSQAGAQIVIAAAAQIRMSGEHKTAVGIELIRRSATSASPLSVAT